MDSNKYYRFSQIYRDSQGGVDKSDILVPGTPVTTTGPAQDKPGWHIFNGVDVNADFLTLHGNNYAAFYHCTMWVKPDIIRAMDISKMSEYPSYTSCNRTFYMQSDGKITARVSDESTHTITSTTGLTAGNWSHILMTKGWKYVATLREWYFVWLNFFRKFNKRLHYP